MNKTTKLRVTLRVTRDIIKRSEPLDVCSCPVAYAANVAGITGACAYTNATLDGPIPRDKGFGQLTGRVGGRMRNFRIPKLACARMRRFDKRLGMSPFSFVLREV